MHRPTGSIQDSSSFLSLAVLLFLCSPVHCWAVCSVVHRSALFFWVGVAFKEKKGGKKNEKKSSSLARASCTVVSLQILIYILILVNKQTTKKKKIQSSKRRRQAILRALTPSGHDISREPSSLKPCAFASFRTEGKKLGFSSEGGGRRVRCSSS